MSKLDLATEPSNDFHLCYTLASTSQQQVAVKFHGVFASHWKSQAFTPE